MKKFSTIKEMPKVERPREKLIEKGPKNLKDEELLAILLGTGVEGKNVIEVAKQILRKYSKKRLLKLTYNDLSKIKGIGPAKACTILAVQELENNAASVILVHNHPSGDPEPSKADLEITKRIQEVGKIMGIDLLDHIIISKNKIFSFKEKKLI